MSVQPTRRDFVAAASLLASGCTAQAASVKGACYHDCLDGCVWTVTVEGGKAVRVEADKSNPITRGKLCPKMDNFLGDIVYNPDRILYPLRRVGNKGEGRFERTTWEQALDDISARLKSIIEEDGPTAILPYSDAGTMGVVQSGSLDRRFFSRLGATRLERAICGEASGNGVAATLGTSTGMLPEDLVHSKLILVWSANPVFTTPHTWQFMEEAKRKGTRVVVIDPQRSATAELADEHISVIPGTDAALALGLMHVIVREKLHDADYVDRYTLGFDRLKKRLDEYPPDHVASITGVPKDKVVSLALAYAKTRPAAIHSLIGMEHRANGGMAFRTVSCLPALVGAWRERGGGLLHTTGSIFTLNWDAVGMDSLENPKIRSVNMVQLGRALTDETMKPRIRALISYNSNPATIAPNQNLVLKGLRRDDLLTVVHEHFVTDTARYADYVLPSTTQVEMLDLMFGWGQRNLALNLPAVPPAGESVPITEFFRRLARRLGMEDSYLYDSDEKIVRTALSSGHPFLKGITYERLARDGWALLNVPEPYLPFAHGAFPTPSGKCEFYSERLIKKGMDPLPAYVPAREKASDAFPLLLHTSKGSAYSLNSSHVNVARSLKANGKPTVKIHPSDASSRGIQDGAMVQIYNDRGSMRIQALVTESTRPGVLWVAHGFWGSRMPGGSSTNALTSDNLADLGGGGDFHDTRVQVRL